MGVGGRPSTCAACGKRLTYKSWYYRNGKHYCTKRCWRNDQAKAVKESPKAAPAPAGASAAAETAPAKPEGKA